MTELTSALASALVPSLPGPSKGPANANAMVALADAAPVFQPTAVPQALEVTAYANALAPSNPGGSETTLAAFRQLVDPVPVFSRYYVPSGSSTEELWSGLLTASVKAGNTFAQQMLNTAALTFASTALAGLTLGETNWHAVYPTDPEWTQLDNQSWTQITIDPNAPVGPDRAYRLIGTPATQPTLQWQAGPDLQAAPLASGTRLASISFEAFAVTLNRPWMNPALFRAAGLYLAGQAAGFYSSGLIAENDGVLPLLPTGFFVARNVAVCGTWDPTDRARLRVAAAEGGRLTLEHFLLGSGNTGHSAPMQFSDGTASSSTVQIVAWISTLVPRFPMIDGTALA